MLAAVGLSDVNAHTCHVLKLDSNCLKAGRSVHASPRSVQIPQCFAAFIRNLSICKNSHFTI